MDNLKKNKAGWKWVGIVVLLIIIFGLWHRIYNLSQELNELKIRQAHVIDNQVELQAISHLLSLRQVNVLKARAAIGDATAMDNLYRYYKVTRPATVTSQSEAFIWGTLARMYSTSATHNQQYIDSLKQQYQDALSSEVFNRAQHQIESRRKAIDTNKAQLRKNVDGMTKERLDSIIDPIRVMTHVLKESLLKTVQDTSDYVVNHIMEHPSHAPDVAEQKKNHIAE